MTPSPFPCGCPTRLRGSFSYICFLPCSLGRCRCWLPVPSLPLPLASSQCHIHRLNWQFRCGNYGKGEPNAAQTFAPNASRKEGGSRGRGEGELKERSSVSISFRTLEFASNICPPTNAKEEGKAERGRRGVGVVGAPRRRLDGIARVVRCRRGLAVADSIRFATIFGVARTDGPRESAPRRSRSAGCWGPGGGGAVIGRVKTKRCHCHVILIGHSITHYFTGVSQTIKNIKSPIIAGSATAMKNLKLISHQYRYRNTPRLPFDR